MSQGNYDTKMMRTEKYAFAFTNADASFAIPPGPKGKKGFLLDVGVSASTTFAGATTKPAAKIGTAGDDDAYMVSREWGALTAPTATSLKALYDENVPADRTSLAAILVNRVIPADTLTILKHVAATGGGAAGVGIVWAKIAWEK